MFVLSKTNNMTEIEQLKHRLAMVADDMKALRTFIAEEGLSKSFNKASKQASFAYIHLNNIQIACDLTDNESLGWKLYSNEKVDKIIKELKELDVDGETMQFILKTVGMEDQMHRQLVMTKPTEGTELLLAEKSEFSK
jgi:hypothetical protein